jgi:hypothetical protein
MFELAIALCHFAGPATTELSCTTIRTTTDDCVETVQQLAEQYRQEDKFIKMAMCIKKPPKSDYPKIQTTKDLF